jgi:hypothetical protein
MAIQAKFTNKTLTAKVISNISKQRKMESLKNMKNNKIENAEGFV